MDVTIINPFLEAAINIFREMFGIEIAAGAPYLLDDLLDHRWEVSGILGMTGGASGVIAIRFTKLLATHILEKSGVECNTDAEKHEMENELIGELTNIISGNATSGMQNLTIQISPPVVVQGKNHKISWPKIAPVVGIPFTSSFGPFEVDVCFKK